MMLRHRFLKGAYLYPTYVHNLASCQGRAYFAKWRADRLSSRDAAPETAKAKEASAYWRHLIVLRATLVPCQIDKGSGTSQGWR